MPHTSDYPAYTPLRLIFGALYVRDERLARRQSAWREIYRAKRARKAGDTARAANALGLARMWRRMSHNAKPPHHCPFHHSSDAEWRECRAGLTDCQDILEKQEKPDARITS